ncbi:18374_t:CDS:2, partial [Dentiscutata erythropus]
SKDHINSNTLSNSDTNPEDNDTSDESLSGDNIDANNTDDSNETSDTDHSNNPNYSNKNLILKHKKTPAGFGNIFAKDVYHKNGKYMEILVKTQGSIGNFQTHLNVYRITKSIKPIEIIAQPTITEMFHCASGQNIRQKESINHALVKWIVTNLQPLYVLKSESFIKFVHVLNLYYEFIKFVHVLNLYYELPSNKHQWKLKCVD